MRIQGLEGRYTLFTQDGFPLFGGFSGSLSIMQIPPLDLRQVEYIKGPASTLYGGGAIAGLINLISKTPDKEGETTLMFNKSHIGATDLNAFTQKQYGKLGYTFLASANHHSYYNPDNDQFSDIPWQQKLNVNPRFFYNPSDKVKMYFGVNTTFEEREGGDIHTIRTDVLDTVNYYKETNNSQRIVTQYKLSYNINSSNFFTFKNGLNYFDRALSIQSTPTIRQAFDATQIASFTEASWLNVGEKYDLVGGLNIYTDQITEQNIDTLDRSSSATTVGSFVQATWYPNDFVNMELGMRTDYNFNFGVLPLPRFSTLFNWTEKITSRVGGAMGYMLPTLFLEEAEAFAFYNVKTPNLNTVNPERSIGVNGDINYKTTLGEKAFFRINQLFFFNQINAPQTLQWDDTDGFYEIVNLNGFKQTKGFESSIKIGYEPMTLFIGYTYTDAQIEYTNDIATINTYIPLTPTYSLKGDLLMDIPDKWQMAIDYEYQSRQYLSNGNATRDLFIMGLVMRRWIGEHFQLFGNLENFTDVRQSKYESLVKNGAETPQFTEVWAPMDGFYANVGFRWKF